MTRTMRLSVAVLVVALALFGVFATTAFASIDTTPVPTLASSSSNPGSGADAWWREGWGNTLYPDFLLNPPGQWNEQTDGYLLGSIYTIDRTGNTIINTSTPGAYYRDSFPTGIVPVGGTSTNKTLDMLGIYMNPPVGGWPAPPAGAHNALEGQWFYHYMFYSNMQYQDGSFDLAGNYTPYPWTVGFGIDLTPPRAVTGLRLRTGLTSSDVTTWTPATRAYITWNAGETDDLSGTGYYQVLVDDKPFMPETSSTPDTGRVYSAQWLPTPDAITIENMPPGAHTVSIQAVDRATNASPPSASKTFYSDPDTPTISWNLPLGTVIDPRTHTMSVLASDLAGDPVVTISLGTTLSPSLLTTTIVTPADHDVADNGVYTFTPDFSAIATGTYTLKATVTDHLSRTVTISKTVTWNPFGLAGTTTDASVDVTGTIAQAPESAETSTGGTTLWTNQLFPTALLPEPSGASDLFYTVGRTPTTIDVNNLQNYYHSLRGDGTELSQVVNIKDTAENPPFGGWPAGPSGSVAPYEGPWYFQWVWYNSDSMGVSSKTYTVKFNVDRTPPLAVAGFSATPTAGVWTSAQRATVTWTPKEYDALSGDMNYLIYLDGNLAMSESATNALAGKATIENMPVGKHTISIAAEDFAGNIGPKSDLIFQSDPDTPTIAWTAPTNVAMTPANHTISVDASDAAGDPTVTFKIDGGVSYATTITAPPYTVSPDLSGLSAGSHLLQATVKDGFGRTVTISKTVSWNSYDGSLDTTGVAGTSSSYYSGQWINTLFPVATLSNLGGGINYNIVQTPSALDVTNPATYYHSVDGAGPLFDHTVDLKDTIDAGVGTWAPGPAGSVSPYEGTWYFQWKWHNAAGYSATTYRLQFNVDLTPPSAVSNFAITPAAGAWTSQQRAKLTWTNTQAYDSLSGVNRYNIYIDDVLREAVGSLEPVPNQLTVEDMPAGRHKVSLAVVDNAGNEGPKTDLYFQSDPDTPTIAWTAPTDNSLNVSNHTLSVDASDSAGDPTVTFKIDGGAAYVATVTAPPYAVSPDLTGLSAGAHTLTATVKDAFGRTVTITKNITWGAYDGSLDTTGVAGTSPDCANGTMWVNTLFPTANLAAPGTASGIVYNIVQTPSAISTVSANNFYHAVQPNGTHFNEIADLKDTIDAGVGTWLSGPAGSAAPYEGTWYFQWKWYGGTPPTSFVSSDTYRIPFKVDLTPPTAVTGFTSNPAAGVWTSAQRLTLRWDDKEYDALSKTKYYQILVDGGLKEIDVQRTDAVPNAVTIENMTAGRHTVSISAVDWAGNVGPAQSLQFLMDTGTPTVKFTQPTSTLTPSSQTVAVSASDSAGDPTVVIQISGGSLPGWVTLATLTKSPYTVTPNFVAMGLTDGTYTLRATATNFINQSATVSENVVWDSAATLVTDPAVDLTPGTSIGTSKSNPSLLSDPDAWWRQGWGNTLTPDFELTAPSSDASHGLVVGMLYDITTAQNDLDTSQPDLYYRSARPSGTNLNQTIDLQGVYNYPPVGGWRPTPIPGAVSGIEGPWYLNLTWFTSMGYSSTRTYHIPMGLDITPPSIVQSMVVSPTTNSSDATSVIATSRIHISWAPKSYDALSGVAYYQVYIDGVASVPDAATNPPQGRVYNIPGASPNSVTIENLTPGKHTIGLAAVDRATNVGKPAETVIYSDPDTPTIQITSPTGSLIGVRPSVAATAADLGGVTSVVFALDGTPISTVTSAPYKSQVDLSAFAAGPHVLTATVTDRFGRQVTDTKNVTLDKTPLVLSSIKTAGSGRKVTVTYTVSRPSTIRFSLAIAAYSAVKAATTPGTYSFTYTYPKGKKYPSATSFKDTFTLSATDSLGNAATATGKVTVTLAKIVKLSGNRIKIIYY